MIYKNHYFSRKLGNNLATKSQTTSSWGMDGRNTG
jgi:hypothetical protein